ncbi:MAG TPA: hypothetical protein VGB97_03710 [Candidatus Paceibacterota bacterium]|jgi:hypothetical protein
MTRRLPINFILAIALLVAALAGYWFWYGTVTKVAAEAAELTQSVRERGEAGGRAAAARHALDDLAADEAAVYQHFVGTDDVVPFLESIEMTGQRLGARVEVVSVGNVPAKPQQPALIQVSLTITGSFDAVMRTIGAIEYQVYDTTLSSLVIDSPSGVSTWTAAATYLVGAKPQATTTPAAPKTP